VGYLW